MAFRYKLPSGEIIEVDSAREIQELLHLLQKDAQSLPQRQSGTASAAATSKNILNEPPETSIGSSKNSTPSRHPSVQDFLNLWAALETEKSRNVMRLFAMHGKKGLTSEQLAHYLGVKRASGIMSGINRQSNKVGFDWKRWFFLNNGVYESDPRAYKNLVEAIASVEPRQAEQVSLFERFKTGFDSTTTTREIRLDP